MTPDELESVYELEGGPLMSYHVRGHVDLAEMAAAAQARNTEDRLGEPRHTYWRLVPWGGGGMQIFESRPGRGAFPVTVVEVNPPRMP